MIGYFDCNSGVAGDMVLGAMIDAGLPLNHLKRELNKLHLRGYEISKKIERRGMIGGTNLQVVSRQSSVVSCRRPTTDNQRHSHYKDILRLISKSRLNKNIRDTACAIFETLAMAEACVHRTSIDKVHFHEVGAVDSIVDIVGTAIGLDYFGLNAVYSSPLPILIPLHPPLVKGGRGGLFIKCEHGKIPVPVPATMEILKGVPVISSPVNGEIVTPTGAAILKTVVKEFGDNPIREIKTIGYGLGDKNFREIPNALRFVIGEGGHLIVIETNIDDMNPQIYDYLIERLLKGGAIDVTVRPVLMKKRRLGVQLQILCEEELKDKLTKIILYETTSLGVRFYKVGRGILDRKILTVKTKHGNIRVKVAKMDGEIVNISPEYEDCKRIAKLKKIPLKDVFLNF